MKFWYLELFLAKKWIFCQFWSMFTENPLFEFGHVWKCHCDVIRWPIFMILVSIERRDPTLYHGTKQSYFGFVNFKFIKEVVTTPPLGKPCYKKGLIGWGLILQPLKTWKAVLNGIYFTIYIRSKGGQSDFSTLFQIFEDFGMTRKVIVVLLAMPHLIAEKFSVLKK